MRSSQYSSRNQQISSQFMGFLSSKKRLESCCHDLNKSCCGISNFNIQLVGLECHRTQARISARSGTAVRTECVWINPAYSAAHRWCGLSSVASV